jgi:hypothetical protein
VPCLSALLVVATFGTARAAPGDVANDCADARALTAAVSQQLGRPLVEGELADLHVATGEQGLVATLSLPAQPARSLAADSCDELVAAIALIVERATVAAPVPAPSPHDDNAVTEPEATAGVPSPDRPSRWQVGGHLAMLAGVGGLPGSQVGGELAASVGRAHVFGELAYVEWAPSGVAGADGLGRVDIGLWTLALRGGWRADPLPIAAWVVGERGESSATTMLGGRPIASAYGAVGVGVGAWWPVTRLFAPMLAIETLDVVIRPRFETGDMTLFEPGAVAARVSLAITATWK